FNLPAPQPIAAATGASLPSSIATPVSHPAWPSQLGQQLIQLVQRGGEQHVQMKLHPAELGPLSISLKMTEHGAQAQFLSAHAQVRQVIEQAIPQLREALAEQGISLSDTSVGEQGFSNQQEAFAQHSTGSSAGGESGVTSVEGETGTPVPVGSSIALDGRVDLYA
ncbi:MAG: flagellar hook-length control protein FliK, partial [Pseudomonadota bacterium]|nr:flagellar hook-length control protein FliK [Pseudomonadota bacterium]